MVPIPSIPLFLRANILRLVGADPALALGFAVLGLTLAAQAGPTLRLGLGGWLRSLPVGARRYRRAMAVALLVPLTPLLVLMVAAAAAAIFRYDAPVDPLRILGLVCSLALAGAAGVPVVRPWIARPIAAAGSLAAVTGGGGILAGLLLGIIWDRVAGPVAVPRHQAGGWRQSPRWLRPMIAWRALGARVVTVSIAPLGVCGAAFLYRINNRLTTEAAGGVTRTAVLIALVLTFAGLADLLIMRRPPWPWARSLPVGSRNRVLDDVIALAVPAAPTLLVALGLDWKALLVGVVTLPALALLAAGAMRRAGGRLSRASGEYLVTGSSLALAVAWRPGLTLVALGSVPLLWWHAARADRRLVVTQWQSLHHQASGDSLAGEAR